MKVIVIDFRVGGRRIYGQRLAVTCKPRGDALKTIPSIRQSYHYNPSFLLRSRGFGSLGFSKGVEMFGMEVFGF